MSKEKNKGEMSFLEHLEELRWHIIRSILAIGVVGVVAFIYHEIVFDKILLAPKNPSFITNRLLCQLGHLVHTNNLCINTKPFLLININISGQFTTHIMVSCIAGLIVAFPYIFWEFWRFLRPALYKHERKSARGAVFYISLLFLLGVLFGFFIVVPLSTSFFGSYAVSEQVHNQINLVSYISMVASVALGSGVVFELPILVLFLTKIGILTPEFLKKYRKHAIIVILVIAAIITPPDIFSQLLVSFPLYLLYEISISISKRIVRQKKEKEAEEEMARQAG
jgi:sec-independent protein translocase protein TatC